MGNPRIITTQTTQTTQATQATQAAPNIIRDDIQTVIVMKINKYWEVNPEMNL